LQVSVEVTRRGTRGESFSLPAPVMRVINGLVFRIFRNRTFNGGHLLVLTTVGARSGERRSSTLGYFPDGDNGWIIIASAAGAAKNPAWLFNMAKHPDQVWIQLGDRNLRVTPRTLKGQERTDAWQRVVTQSPGYANYETKTDREIPIVRLTPAT
jgi:deazaflavin-dependent oxidoreductase (nitroreductase family)